jgi:potassium-transporting ATPase potassium-binding subunit
MSAVGWLQIVLFFAILIVIAIPLGIYLYRVFEGGRTPLDPVLRPVERVLYAACGINAHSGQHWTSYAASVLAFNLVGLVVVYALQRLQGGLPLNPEGLGAVAPDLSFNTAVSFTTNTNWQAYSGESTMSYLTQMAGLAFQNFVSAATGIAVAIAVVRGFTRRAAADLGNFWVDLTRATLWVLLPGAIVLALVFAAQGAVQNLRPYAELTVVEGTVVRLPMGPGASQEAIKLLGTNGGGFFNANSAHPLSNPTPFTNLLQMLAIFAIPAALTYTFGRMAGDQRQGWAIFAAMSVLFLGGVAVVYAAEAAGNPTVNALGIGPNANLEGKELRFGVGNSALFAVVTTAASCGAVNAFLDSFTPLGGLVPMLNIQLGEIIFGGVGSGLYGMLIFVVLAVFLAGLMVGRTPEYLGKKLQAREVKWATLAVLAPALSILGFTAVASVTDAGTSSVSNPGPHGFSQMLYAFTSGTGNNGSAFGGLNANTVFYNVAVGLAMLVGRYFVIIPVLGIAGALVVKQRSEVSAGTFPTHGPLFVVLLVFVILIVGALTYFPSYALGPVVEHLIMNRGGA